MYQLIALNQRNSIFLVMAMGILLSLFGGIFFFISPRAGTVAILVCLCLWMLAFVISWSMGDDIILRAASAYRMKGLKYKRLQNVVEELSIAAGIPVPTVYIINSNALNAFAIGKSPDTAKIAVTTGLLDKLNREELQGVIAHEMAHICNRDTLYMMLLISCVGLIALLAEVAYLMVRGALESGHSFDASDDIRVNIGITIFLGILLLLLAVFAPVISQLIYLAASRRREYLADATGVMICRNPTGLASALLKISQESPRNIPVNGTLAPLYIVNPLSSLRGSGGSLWDTHPPLMERINILKQLGANIGKIESSGMASYWESYKSVTGQQTPYASLTQGFVMPAPVVPITKGEEEFNDVAQEARESTSVLRQCLHCKKFIQVPRQFLGVKLKCKYCGEYTALKRNPKKILLSKEEMKKQEPSGSADSASPSGGTPLVKPCMYCGGKMEMVGQDQKVLNCLDCGRIWKTKISK